jgi:hypothetical protein
MSNQHPSLSDDLWHCDYIADLEHEQSRQDDMEYDQRKKRELDAIHQRDQAAYWENERYFYTENRNDIP